GANPATISRRGPTWAIRGPTPSPGPDRPGSPSATMLRTPATAAQREAGRKPVTAAGSPAGRGGRRPRCSAGEAPAGQHVVEGLPLVSSESSVVVGMMPLLPSLGVVPRQY